MKKDIILCGVGGQGILSVATIIGEAATKAGVNLKQAEVHGMSQRGGDVQSNLRLSSDPIHSDLIARGAADLVVSLEPMEALRYAGYLNPHSGWIVTNTVPFVNITNYPEMSDIQAELDRLPRVIAFDVDAAAKQISSPRSSNMVLLGACAPILGIAPDLLANGIRRVFAAKGQAIVDANISAFNHGLAVAQSVIK